MTRQITEQENPPDAGESLDEASFAVVKERARVREVERSEDLKDEVGNVRVFAIRATLWGGLTVWCALMVSAVCTIGVIVAHALVLTPLGTGWLKPDHLQALVTWYSDASPALVPALLLANPWILHFLARRFRE